MPPISDGQRRAVLALKDALRRAGVEDANPTPEAGEALLLWIDAVDATSKAQRREVRKKTEIAEAIIATAPRPGSGSAAADEAPWRRLEDACRRVEQEIRAPASLRARLDEGRRSMMPRLEHATRERLVPLVTIRRGHLQAELDPVGVKALQDELPGWLTAWSEYAYGWYDTDFDRVVEDAWSPREGALPLAAPRLPDLVPPVLAADLRFPVISMQKEQSSTLGGVFRHGRQGMMMVVGAVGLAGATSLRDDPWFIGAVTIGSLYLGFSQATAERDKQRQTLETDVRSRADQSTRDMLRVWLDRVTDKLNEDARSQLQTRRTAFVAWYRETAAPAQERSRAAAQKTADDIDKARRELPKLQERGRDLEKVDEAIKAARSFG